ncbi:MAG: prepilin-type N-terminal cleavage/methylation domain-containing protein [bacterium]|nr:MAG: prepilin-type N-terminal cleavage/methylation domain-containing protein [bacterium]
MKKNIKGFTLTELLIVVGLLSFLALLIILFLRNQVHKGNDARRKAEIKRIGIAAEEYEKDNDCYPLSSLVACNPGSGLLPYLDKIPCDPVTKASYLYEHEDSSCPKWYRIYGRLDNESDVDSTPYIGPNSAFDYVYSSPNAPGVVPDVPAPTASGGGGGGAGQTTFYGCFSGSCMVVQWDVSRPGPACDPNFQNPTCYGQCSNLNNECQPWNQ